MAWGAAIVLALLVRATPCAAEPAGGSETVRLELEGEIAPLCSSVGSSPALSVELRPNYFSNASEMNRIMLSFERSLCSVIMD